MTAAAQGLIAARLRPPFPSSLRTGTHTALVGRLRGRAGGAVVVRAPSGYGRGVLLAHWDAQDPRPFAWVTLAAGDDDAGRLLTYLVEAVCGVLSTVADGQLRAMLAEPQPDLTGRVMPGLLNAIEADGTPFVLVVRDVRHLEGPGGSAQVVRQLLAYCPPNLTVVLAGRTVRVPGLARLRAAGAVLDLDERELRLTTSEVADVVAMLVPDAPATTVERVAAASGGWPAAAVLACGILAGRASVDDATVIATLEAEGGHLLGEKVIGELPSHLLAVLQVVARLPFFDLVALRELVDVDDVVALVDELRGYEVLLEPGPTPSTWRVSARVLDGILASRPADELAAKLGRAAELLVARDEVLAAFAVLDEIDDVPRMVELVAARWVDVFEAGHLQLLDGWLRQLGDDVLRADARLLLVQAKVALARRDRVGLEHALAAIRTAAPRTPTDGSGTLEGNVALLRAHRALRFLGDGRTALHEAQVAVASTWPSPVYAVAADLAHVLALVVTGDDDRAREVAEATLARHTGAEGTLTHAAMLAVGALLRPRPLHEVTGPDPVSVTRAVTAWSVVEGARAAAWPNSAIFHLALASADLHRGDLDAVEDHLDAARALLRRGPDRCVAVLVLHLEIELAAARGDLGRASRAVEQVLQDLRGWQDPGAQPERFRRLARRLGLADQELPVPLTSREREILLALASAPTRADLAAQFFVSVDTVKTHLGAIYRKLGVAGRGEALERARRLGLL